MATEGKTGPNLKKVEGLLVLLKDGHEKQAALIEEINALLGGGAGIAAQMKEFEQAFDLVWCQRYARGENGRYIWRFAQDRAQIKKLLKTLGLEEMKLRAARYIADDDPYRVRARHPFGLFVSNINSYAREAAAPADFALGDTSPAVGCTHTPRCASDVEHTRKRGAEMRAS